jgi:hypothetical protein
MKAILTLMLMTLLVTSNVSAGIIGKLLGKESTMVEEKVVVNAKPTALGNENKGLNDFYYENMYAVHDYTTGLFGKSVLSGFKKAIQDNTLALYQEPGIASVTSKVLSLKFPNGNALDVVVNSVRTSKRAIENEVEITGQGFTGGDFVKFEHPYQQTPFYVTKSGNIISGKIGLEKDVNKMDRGAEAERILVDLTDDLQILSVREARNARGVTLSRKSLAK